MNEHRNIFTPQYTDDSGPGSKLESTAPYREFLEDWIHKNKVRSILDLGCGDMEVMSHVDLSSKLTDDGFAVHYRGIDCIEERIAQNKKRFPHYSFACHDLRSFTNTDLVLSGWAMPHTLVLVKDVIQHWATPEILGWLKEFRPYQALVTNCNYGPTVNTEIATGGWRAIDLTAPPFSIGEVVFQWTYNGATKDVVLIKSRS